MSYTEINLFRCFHCGFETEDASELWDEHLQNGACVILGP